MSTTTIRIRSRDREVLRQLAKESGKPMRTVLEEAIEAYSREAFVKACNAGYARLRENPKAWADYVKERDAWDATLSDGIGKED